MDVAAPRCMRNVSRERFYTFGVDFSDAKPEAINTAGGRTIRGPPVATL